MTPSLSLRADRAGVGLAGGLGRADWRRVLQNAASRSSGAYPFALAGKRLRMIAVLKSQGERVGLIQTAVTLPWE